MYPGRISGRGSRTRTQTIEVGRRVAHAALGCGLLLAALGCADTAASGAGGPDGGPSDGATASGDAGDAGLGADAGGGSGARTDAGDGTDGGSLDGGDAGGPAEPAAIACAQPGDLCPAHHECREALCRFAPTQGLWVMDSMVLIEPDKLADIVNPFIARQIEAAEIIPMLRVDDFVDATTVAMRAGNGFDGDFDDRWTFDRRWPSGVNSFRSVIRGRTFTSEPFTYHVVVYPTGAPPPLDVPVSRAILSGAWGADLDRADGRLVGTLRRSDLEQLYLAEGGSAADLLDLVNEQPDTTICSETDATDCEPGYSFEARLTGFRGDYIEYEGPHVDTRAR